MLVFLVRKQERLWMPNVITGANAGGLPQLPGWTPCAARIAQFWRSAGTFENLRCLTNNAITYEN
jgi:hypothetical protein